MNDFIFYRIAGKADVDFLYDCFSSDDQFLYSTKLNFSSKRNFEVWLNDRLHKEFHDFFVIKDKRSMLPIGYIHNYDFSLTDGHCKLVVYISKKYRNTGIGGFVTVRYMKYLFDEYPLRKLYSTIYDYNTESLKSNIAAGFEEEGCIDGYRYHDGIYHKIHYLSMNRKKFKEILEWMI